MLQKLAKGIAHFFAKKNIIESENEVIYAYGAELLFSDLLNGLIALLSAALTKTIMPTIVFLCVFMVMRRYSGGYHANSHLGCTFILVIVILIFSLVICKIPIKYIGWANTLCVAISLVLIYAFAPVAHLNKPVSENKLQKMKIKGRVVLIALTFLLTLLYALKLQRISLFISSGILLSAIAVLTGSLSIHNKKSNEAVK